jgi:hypothetical protein
MPRRQAHGRSTTHAPGRRRKDSEDERLVCPRCGRPDARIIGRSETLPVVYLRCDGCHLPSVAAA